MEDMKGRNEYLVGRLNEYKVPLKKIDTKL